MDANYLVQTVKKDLQYLRDEWTQGIDDDSLRRSSTVLRRLLVDNELLTAWRQAGFVKQPKLEASTLDYILTHFDEHKIEFAAAGGARFEGLEVCALFAVRHAMSPREARHVYEAGKRTLWKEYLLDDFVKAPCMVIRGTLVNRRLLIQYVANKLGGSHIDTERRLGSESPKKREKEQVFAALDGVYSSTKVANKNAIFYELLSIGQSLIRSPDIIRFIEE